jgi:hypothetical protein
MRGVIGFVAVLALAGGSAWAVDGPKGGDKGPIPAAEARDHIGKTRTVTLTVKHAKDGIHMKNYYLDSEADYKDPKNLAIVIAYEHADAFKKAGIADIVTHFDGKAIRVTGAIVKESSQTRIRVTEPKQIELAEVKKIP